MPRRRRRSKWRENLHDRRNIGAHLVLSIMSAAAAEHNYLVEIRRLQAEGKLNAPGVHHVYVAHDKWCSIYSGGRCNCNPEVTAEEAVRK